ncbi:nuclear receptor corepressor 2-like [Planococcus citri]|uniref:nuclear receptor corepressor 2-like n=1 Tax=Planococcus citri TaxID=170843 RepID=UPI0031F7A7E2
MKRRKPILEFQSSKDSSSHSSKNTPGISSLVCYSEDSDAESNANIFGANPSYRTADSGLLEKPTTPWQACVDENTGYSYYWNVETNQVTWEVPADYLAYQTQLQQWKTRNNARFEELSEIQQNSGKTNILANEFNYTSDSDTSVKEEKIELISAYGATSEDESESEQSHFSKKSHRNMEKLENKSVLSNKINQPSHNREFISPVTNSIIPSGSNTNCAFLQNDLSTHSKPNEGTSDNKTNKPNETVYPWLRRKESSPKPMVKNSHNDSSDEDEDENDEELDDVIISRLRKKAMLLKQLGGEVPREILSVFDNSKTAEDIIAEIEKEIPADSVQASAEVNNEPEPLDVSNKGNKSSDAPPPKPLFPILNYAKKEEPQFEFKVPSRNVAAPKSKMKNIQKIKLSARAKELIRTSLLTAKARATNFVETEDGLKPAEEVQKLEEQQKLQTQVSENDAKDIIIDDPEDSLLEKNGLQELNDEPSAGSSVIEDLELKKSAPKANYFNLNEDKKTVGLGTKTEEIITKRSDLKVMKSDFSNDGKFDFQTSFIVYHPKQKKDDTKKADDAKNNSLWSKCEEFLQSELNRPEIKETDKDAAKKDDDKSKSESKQDTNDQKFNDIDIDEVLDTKNENEEQKMTDLTQIIMEKLKYLSEAKSAVSSVQVMAIQIETLVGAWQSGALAIKYLSDWLDASLVQLKFFEEAAAPKGWLCEWDRSYGRYYYRNKVTGSIQWDYPDYDEKNGSSSSSRSSRKSSSSRRSSHSRPRTPPPPVISDMVPPPPPVISERDRDSRKRRPSPRRDSDRRRRDEGRYRPSSYPSKSKYRRGRSRSRSPASVLPPLPPTPPKPATPPPPPPSSPPPLPPPPPVGTADGRTYFPEYYSDKCTTVTPMEIEEDEKPVKLHDELDSFYSDIASIEATFNHTNNFEQPAAKFEEPRPPQPEYFAVENSSARVEEKVVKKKKKVKLDSGLSLKKKGLETLVAKWQKVSSDNI